MARLLILTLALLCIATYCQSAVVKPVVAAVVAKPVVAAVVPKKAPAEGSTGTAVVNSGSAQHESHQEGHHTARHVPLVAQKPHSAATPAAKPSVAAAVKVAAPVKHHHVAQAESTN